MKIIQIIPTLNSGGGEKFGVDLSNELSLKGNDVILIIISKINKKSILYNKISKDIKLISLNKQKGFDPFIILKLYNIIKTEKPDIVHTHLRSLIYSFPINIILKNKVIHTVHSLANKEASGIKQNIYKILFKKFNFTPVAIGNTVLDSITNTYNLNPPLIYNGVPNLKKSNAFLKVREEIKNYKLTENTIVFVHVARLSTEKNQLMLIEAVDKLKKENNDIILIIIGSKNTDLYANKCISSIKNKSFIHYLGEKDNISDYLLNANALCLSSIYEGLPLIILEAMSIGLPVLSTPAGGVPDVIHNGQNGYLSNGFNAQEYTIILELFLKKYNSFNTNRIISIFEHKYTIQKCTNNYIDLYHTILNNKGKK